MTDSTEITGAISRVRRGTRSKDVILICDELSSRLKTKPAKAPKNGDWPQWKDTERKKLWGKLTQAVRRARRGKDEAKIKAAEKALKKDFPDAALLKG